MNRLLQNEVRKVHILKSKGIKSFYIKRKVEKRLDQLAELLLIVKNRTKRLDTWELLYAERECSYCRRSGRGAANCFENP